MAQDNTILTTNLLLGLFAFDCDRKPSYVDCKGELQPDPERDFIGDNPDKAENLNEKGIMSSNDRDLSCALDFFKEAIAMGNSNAMINGFCTLWSFGRFHEAAEWLNVMNSLKNKNIKCLWNEAMLYFYGNKLENNPLKRSVNKAKDLLDYILIHFEEFISDNRKIVQSAYIFSLKHGLHKIGDDVVSSYEKWKIEGWQNRRNLAVTGNNLYYALYNEYHHLPWDVGHVVGDEWLERFVFNNLDELYLEDDWHLWVTLGDIHGFQAYQGKKKVPLNKVLRGAISKRAAWQSYLLYSAYRIMPLEDHDNYDACRPIFTTRDLDLNSFATFMPDNHYDKVVEDIKNLELTDKDIYPIVHQISDFKFEVECIWWNDWKGLFKERAVVEFAPKTYAPKMEITGEGIIYDYDCPVCI